MTDTRSSPDIVERMKHYIHGENDDYIPEVLQLACAEIDQLRRDLAHAKAMQEVWMNRAQAATPPCPRTGAGQMSDLVERLRKNFSETGRTLLTEAADRIEALEAALREAGDIYREATSLARARIKALETALRASRLVLIERGIDPRSRIVRVIDAALAPEQDK